jgi:hypothetical protein
MYARIATADIVPGMMDRFVEQTHEIMIPAYIGKQGLMQATTLLDRTNEVGRLLTVWRSEADMMAREQDTAYRSKMDNVRAKSVPIFYEVCAHESGDPSSYAFARVTSGDVLSGQSENFSRKLREEVIPAYKSLDGFAGALALMNRENAKAAAVIFWNSRAASEQRITPTADMDNYRKIQESVVCDVVANHSVGA